MTTSRISNRFFRLGSTLVKHTKVVTTIEWVTQTKVVTETEGLTETGPTASTTESLDALIPTTISLVQSTLSKEPTLLVTRNSTITRTIFQTVTSTVPSTVTSTVPTTASIPETTPPSSQTSTSPAGGYVQADPKHFPTALVAILVGAFAFLVLLAIILYLYYRGVLSYTPPRQSSSHYDLLGALGLSRHRDNKRAPEQVEEPPHVDPIAEAIRKEEQERLRRQKRSGMATFYAPQVRHLVDLLGSKEELRVDVKRYGNRRWPHAKK